MRLTVNQNRGWFDSSGRSQILTNEENIRKSNKFEMSEGIATLPGVEELRDC